MGFEVCGGLAPDRLAKVNEVRDAPQPEQFLYPWEKFGVVAKFKFRVVIENQGAFL
jgi:hypothetical protein